MAGLVYEPHPTWTDVLVDGSLIGTVHIVQGGWVFYSAGRTRSGGHLPSGVGRSRDAAVRQGLRSDGREVLPGGGVEGVEDPDHR